MTITKRHNEPRAYMVLEAATTEREKLQFLTTRVMRWSQNTWIMDISPFACYWRIRARSAGVTIISLWRAALDRVFEEPELRGGEKVITISPAYRAACAVNPWLAVLMLQGMQAGDVHGLVWQQSRTGRALLAGIGWNSWWQCAAAAGDHFLGVNRRGFKPAKFRQRIHRLKLAAVRLNLRRPGEMQILSEAGVKKRFGPELALLWRWTFDRSVAAPGWQDSPQAGEVPFLSRMAFPWRDHCFGEPPRVKRVPDFSLERWEQVAPQLNEDLDRIARCLGRSGERVVRLDWRVMLQDLKCLQVPIRFRNPHDMRREAGDHRTALLQARYAFEDAAGKVFPVSPLSGEVDTMLLITGWELVLGETLVIPDICFDIFGEIADREKELEILLRLENELPVPLQRFSTCGDWLPEDSYCAGTLSGEADEGQSPEMQPSLEAVAETRPLYIRNRPLPLETTQQEGRDRFLESTLDKWWLKGGAALTERSYFKRIDEDGNATWIYRDSTGGWYQHGIFG